MDETHKANLQQKAYHLKYFEVFFFCCISEKLQARETERGRDYFFNSQNFVKSHSIFVKNSMDLKRGKGIIIDICYSRLKQKNPTAIHHFQNHPVGHRLRRLVPFS